MYAVTGASGELGRLAIASLMRRIPSDRIVALAGDPAKADDLASAGIEVRRFDHDVAETLDIGLDGVERLLIASDVPDQRVAQHRGIVEACIRASVHFVAYTSIIHANWNPLSLAVSHYEIERVLAASGLAHVILRNGWCIENYFAEIEAAIASGTLLGSSGDGGISGAARQDYAEAAAEVLVGEASGSHTYELAGDDAFTMADIATVLGELSGRPIGYRNLSEADYRDALTARGLPTGCAFALAEYSARADGGVLANDSGTLRRLIGRPTKTLREALVEKLANDQARAV